MPPLRTVRSFALPRALHRRKLQPQPGQKTPLTHAKPLQMAMAAMAQKMGNTIEIYWNQATLLQQTWGFLASNSRLGIWLGENGGVCCFLWIFESMQISEDLKMEPLSHGQVTASARSHIFNTQKMQLDKDRMMYVPWIWLFDTKC